MRSLHSSRACWTWSRAADGWEAAIAEGLRKRQLLLVLDNCEHVLDAAATLADALVKTCPDVVVLATSREGLGLAGERIMSVGSLALPRVEDRPEVGSRRPMR